MDSPSTIEQSYFFADGKRLEAARIEARCPVFVLQGAQDEYGTVAQIDAIRTRIPLASAIMFEKCKHAHLRTAVPVDALGWRNEGDAENVVQNGLARASFRFSCYAGPAAGCDSTSRCGRYTDTSPESAAPPRIQKVGTALQSGRYHSV